MATDNSDLDVLKASIGRLEQQLGRREADYTQLKLDYARLKDESEQLKPRLAQAEQERAYLQQNLTRFEQDLRALQATRTVRTSQRLGLVAGKVRQRLRLKRRKGSLQANLVVNETLLPQTVEQKSPEKMAGAITGSYDGWFWERYSLDAALNARLWDFSQAELERSRAVGAAHPEPLKIKSLVWFMPPFQHAYYGGVHTILRFAAYFKETKGVSSHFVTVRPPADGANSAQVSQAIGEAFPMLSDALVTVVQDYGDLADLPPADAAIATLWNTAYYALKFNRVKRKFYFVQDYEPVFYPAGTSYALAEAPYQFGFYGLTNTIALKELYEQYGGVAEYFTPAVDTNIFYPAKQNKQQGEPWKLFFYGRPGQPRNAFELGTTALRKLKNRLGDKVQIVTAGAEWQPSQYDLDGVIENLGLLRYEETAELYRTCDVGLVLMFTRHPSYLPFELMASGALVVTNHNSATRWLLKSGENCLLAASSASSLAEMLELGLTDTAFRNKLKRRALADIRQHYADWNAQAEKIYRFMGTGSIIPR